MQILDPQLLRYYDLFKFTSEHPVKWTRRSVPFGFRRRHNSRWARQSTAPVPVAIPASADTPELKNLQSNSERIGRTPADRLQPGFFAAPPLEASASQRSGVNRFSVVGPFSTPAFEQAPALHTIDAAIDRQAIALENWRSH
jgi:hypothetical protein